MNAERISNNLNELRDLCFAASFEAGWWEPGPEFLEATKGSGWTDEEIRLFWRKLQRPVKLALVHSEASEMLEGLRKNAKDDKLPHRQADEVEAADLIIRVLDYCGEQGLDVGGALIEKMVFNASRADHKPEARAADGGKNF